MVFKYEVVPDGENPTFERKSQVAFKNPVQVGDLVMVDGRFNHKLQRVTSIHHYPKCSIIRVALD